MANRLQLLLPRAACLCLLVASTAGCQSLFRRRAPAKPQTARVQPARSPAPRCDAQAQRAAYDQGLKFFGEERYAESRKAWQEAVRCGPSTELGRQAAAHLKKVNQILKSLKELEAP